MNIIVLLSGLLIGSLVSGGFVYFFISSKFKKLSKGENSRAKELILKAKEDALRIKEEAKENLERKKRELYKKSQELELQKEKLQLRATNLQKRESEIERLKKELKSKKIKQEELIAKQVEELEKIATLSKEEAKKKILSEVEKTLENEIGKKLMDAEEQAKTEAEKKAKDILVDAMQHGATDYVAEYTVSTVYLPSPEVKGKIIGKEGRNIRSFEEQTGVTLDLDESPETVRISSFDAVRREIARVSLERLIKDGRIHPARIEEIVAKTRAEIEKIMFREGEKLCHKVGVYNLPRDIIANLGKYKYRYSYGQNMIIHTLEETQIGVKIAQEIGADVNIVKLACLLHDIGKVFIDKEGSHIELGVEYLKKFNLPEPVITAVAEHHDDHPSTVEGAIVQIADNISGGRPGARYEDYEAYAKRLKALEETALSFEGVEKVYAISAGRELRVIVNSDKTDDSAAVKLANDIATKIQKDHSYPGTVKVTVIREKRAVGIAK